MDTSPDEKGADADVFGDHFDALSDVPGSQAWLASFRSSLADDDGGVRSHSLTQVDDASPSYSEETPDLATAQAEAAAWRASHEATARRLAATERALAAEKERSATAQTARGGPEHVGNAALAEAFQRAAAAEAALDAARRAATAPPALGARTARDEHHEEALLLLHERLEVALEENAGLRAALEEDRRQALELRGRAESTARLRLEAAEASRERQALEERVDALYGALNGARAATEELSERLAAAESVATQAAAAAEAACAARDEAGARAQRAEARAAALDAELAALRVDSVAREEAAAEASGEQLDALQDLARRRGAALQRITEILSGTDADADSDGRDPGAAGDPDRAVALVVSVCHSIVDAERQWKEEREELQAVAVAATAGGEEARARALEERVGELEGALRVARGLAGGAEAAETRAVAAQEVLEVCREELAAAAAKAASAVLEASKLRDAAAAAAEGQRRAETAAAAAAAAAAELRGGAQARDHRADEMRAAAAAAMDLTAGVQRGIQEACATAAAQLRAAAAAPGPSAQDAGPRSAELDGALDALHACIDHLEGGQGAEGPALGAAVGAAMGQAAAGFTAVAGLFQEHRRVHLALSRAFNGEEPAENSAPQRLEALFSGLLDRFSRLTDAIVGDKTALEADLAQLQDEHAQLLAHAESLESVLRSAVGAAPGDDAAGEALVQLALSRRRVVELETQCEALAETAEAAQEAAAAARAAAARDWADVRSDVAQLVQHAERAQAEAEAGMRQHRAEAAREVAAARAKEHAAAAARAEAEAAAAALREEAARLSREVQTASAVAESWEGRTTAAEKELQSVRRLLAKRQVAAAAPEGRDGGRGMEEALQARVEELEDALEEVRVYALSAGAALGEARAAAEEAAAGEASHRALADAASRRADAAVEAAAEAQGKLAALELTMMEAQTAAAAAAPLAAPAQALAEPEPRGLALLLPQHAGAAPEGGSRALLSAPPGADAPALRRRLEAALRQVDGLRALSGNLEAQLTAAQARNAAAQAAGRSTPTAAVDTAHALIDALQAQVGGSGPGLPSQTNLSTVSGGPLPRVVELWRQAVASRDANLADAGARLQAALAALGAKEAALAAARQENAALKAARREAEEAAAAAECQQRNAEDRRRRAQADLMTAQAAAEAADVLHSRVDTLEGAIEEAEGRAAAAEARAEEAEREAAGARARAEAASEQLRRAQEAEGRARAAEERAAEAETALAAHLEGAARGDATSLGRQLEAAWAAERDLAARVHELQADLAGARAQAAGSARRGDAAEAQLREALESLAEQGDALEALQRAIKVRGMS